MFRKQKERVFFYARRSLSTIWLRGLPTTDRKCQPALRRESGERPYRQPARRDQQSMPNRGWACSICDRLESPRCLRGFEVAGHRFGSGRAARLRHNFRGDYVGGSWPFVFRQHSAQVHLYALLVSQVKRAE